MRSGERRIGVVERGSAIGGDAAVYDRVRGVEGAEKNMLNYR
jgi:hypothetical protein